ncbi:hypothetical protein QZH56_35915 [Streptomyces olivoreticuli]|uniref:hypothetical protein n=1 Tax=Streptomyces olivoreticuli TaxID=68246 RepID=UPI002657BA7A|nr:hypothetical protein [Streptomyces olivoreticuli]WKK24003.1 hypothetical protein QZH56_35915 [Streptomyces olivoreticuli]
MSTTTGKRPTPYGTPPRARLSLLHTREAYGIVWVWHAHDDTPPEWELPDLPASGNTPAHHAIDLAGHPQDVVENAIDYGHIPEIHGVGFKPLAEPVAKGRTYQMTYDISRPMPPLGTVRQRGEFTLVGLAGFRFNLAIGQLLTAQAWVLSTPIGPWRVRMWYATDVTIVVGEFPAPWHRLPQRPLQRAASSLMNAWLIRDGKADLPVYHHKTYVPHPKLNDADGPIGAFRQWASQFYPSDPPTNSGQHQQQLKQARASGI